MMSEAHLPESEVAALQIVRSAVEADGMTFHDNPPPEVIPAFLGNYRPRAIALRPGGGIVIEVARRGSPSTQRRVSEVAQKIAGQNGWEFRVVYLPSSTEDSARIQAPRPEHLRAAFSEIESLMVGGHPAAALLIGWATLESLARLASDRSGEAGPPGLSPIQAIQRLAAEGYIENDDADRLRHMARLRNAVVHGDLSVDVPVATVQDLLAQLKSIVPQLASATNT